MRRRGTGFWALTSLAVGVSIPTIVNAAADDPTKALEISIALILVAAAMCGIMAYREGR